MGLVEYLINTKIFHNHDSKRLKRSIIYFFTAYLLAVAYMSYLLQIIRLRN